MAFGIISDTHGLLRPEALRAAREANPSLQGFDSGDPGIVDELKRIAPVSAIRVNVDTGYWAGEFCSNVHFFIPGADCVCLASAFSPWEFSWPRPPGHYFGPSEKHSGF